MKTLKKAFELNTMMVDKVYARQTLIQFFHAMQTQQNKESVIQLPSADIKLQEVISWSVWERFSNDPINGWMKSVSYAIPLQNKEKKERMETMDSEQHVSQISTSATGHVKLQDIFEEAADSILMEQLT